MLPPIDAVWCWKGDYWNLGPGAEIGIYVQEDEQRAKRGFYDIDKDNLKVKTHMKVDYDGKVGLIKQTNWWITMFMPWKGQRIDLDMPLVRILEFIVTKTACVLSLFT